MREKKDSGINWIGSVPVGWEINKIKYLTQSRYEKFKLSEVNQYIGLENVEKGTGHYVESESEYEDGVYDGCEKGDLLYGKLRPNLAKAMIAPFRACCTGEFEVISHCSIGLKYLQYYMLTDGFTHTVTSSMYGAKMPRANWDFIKNIEIAFPDESERDTIVKHLDAKCAEIDALSADIQSQIDTLEQYKKSLIFKTVKSGINNSEMKDTDSGVWDKIPESWELKDIKYLFEIVKRIAGKEGYDVLSVTQRGLVIKDLTSGEGQLANDYSGYQFVYPTDFVMNHMDLLTGWVDLSDKFGVTSPDYRVFRLRDKENNSLDYYKYVMQCCYMNRIFYSLGQGVSNLGRWRLQTSSFNNFKVPVPPLDEQKEIANYLNEQISEINDIIDLKREQITTITEYKKSLIYEYVTGKKEL